jgi:hypothetical protein
MLTDSKFLDHTSKALSRLVLSHSDPIQSLASRKALIRDEKVFNLPLKGLGPNGGLESSARDPHAIFTKLTRGEKPAPPAAGLVHPWSWVLSVFATSEFCEYGVRITS